MQTESETFAYAGRTCLVPPMHLCNRLAIYPCIPTSNPFSLFPSFFSFFYSSTLPLVHMYLEFVILHHVVDSELHFATSFHNQRSTTYTLHTVQRVPNSV
jgi:hypothetical protein